jgi:glucose-1-phosphate cytidylyltransferase
MNNIAVVILCGGRGTRSHPFTEYIPKVMMAINGTPIVIHLMRIYAAQGFRKFILSVGYRKEILIDYFEGRRTDWEIDIVDTGEDADTGDRIQRCSHLLTDTFFANYGDGLGNVDLHSLLARHKATGGLATLTTVPLLTQYGLVVFSRDGAVSQFIEKPVIPDSWINAGFFVFEKDVFSHWKGHNLESEVLPALADERVLYVHQHHGFWKSMDTSKDQQALEKLYMAGNPPWAQLPLPQADPLRKADAVKPSMSHALPHALIQGNVRPAAGRSSQSR